MAGKSEDAVVESRGIVQVLENSPKQLEKLLVVGLKRLRVWSNHFAKQ